VVSVAAALRDGGRLGLVYGNGEVVTKHHALLLAARPHPDGYVGTRDPVATARGEVPPIVEVAEGPATVETFTVEHSRDGEPTTGYVIGRTETGTRFAALSLERATLARLVARDAEPVGCKGSVRPGEDGRNRFEIS
jgi:acetyl-CoA C-acetyltransferase